jgi:hypothetical protein
VLEFTARWTLVGCLLIAGCSNAAPSFKLGENLEAEGKFEEAAQKFELVCAEAPAGPECPKAGARATNALSTAATKAMEKNEFGKAERLLLRALLDADETAAKDIEARLAKEDLVDGIRYEYAVADADKQRASITMKALAESDSPLAKLASAWGEKERSGLLVLQVKAACGPDHEGSCTGTFERLEALPQKPAGYDEAKAAYETEQKRTEKVRAELERFLTVFAQRGKKQSDFDQCLQKKPSEQPEFVNARECNEETTTDNKLPFERFDAQQTEDNLFRRRLATLGDSGLTAAYEERRVQALTSGEVPKPAAKTAAGGAK